MDPMLEALISFQVWDSAAALCLNPTFMSNIRFLSFLLSFFFFFLFWLQIYFFEQGAASLNSLNQYVDFTLPIEETFFEKRAPAIEFMKTLSLVVPLKIDPNSDPSARTGQPLFFRPLFFPFLPSSLLPLFLTQSTRVAKLRILPRITAMVCCQS